MEEQAEDKKLDLQKIYIRDYGNLVLNITGSNDIGMVAYSEKRNETLFIPWTSIIMCSKIDEKVRENPITEA